MNNQQFNTRSRNNILRVVPAAEPLDFDQIDAALLPRADTLLTEWLPDGKLSGHEYTAINPTRADHRPGSFKINTATGIWEDFATGDKGPGLVSLYAYIHRMNKPEAAAELAQRHGLQAASARDKPPPKARPREEWQPVMPVPDDAPPPPTYTAKLGETVTRYDYRGINGRLLHLVYRVERTGPDGKPNKKFAPATWCKHKETGAHGWQWKGIPNNRPLYGLDELAEKVGAPVCINEGEKAVDAARQLLPAWVCVTSSGGSKAGHLADWTPLVGRRVIVWMDNDDAGRLYAQAVTAALRAAGVRSITWLSLDIFGDNLRKGYDAADALADGWTADRLAKAMQKDDATEQPQMPDDDPDEGKPIIRLIPGNRNKVIDKAERLLLGVGEPLFDRGGQLVRPVIQLTDVPIDGVTLPAGSLVIKEITTGWLTCVLDKHITWMKLSRVAMVRTDCPAGLADLYLQRSGDWNVPVLTGIVECPTLRPNGTLLTEPGYDPRSGLYLDYTGLPVIVPEAPTKEEATKALATLKEIVAEFPFVDDTSRTVALSKFITDVIRRALRKAPFHGFDSPEKGSGKSLLANVSAIIATGRSATTATLTTSPDENQKRLEAYLIRGVSNLNIDNASRPISGDFLCSLATEETVDPRVLGHSTFVKVKTNTVSVSFTGNNLVLEGDITRRSLLCRIDAEMERPDTRTFKIKDLKRHVAAHRHELLAAVLTIVRAYVVAGYPTNYEKDAKGETVIDADGNPKPVAPLGDFLDWDSMVRGPLLWLGEADPLSSRARILETDPDTLDLGALLSTWFDLFGQTVMTAKEAAAKATPPEPAWAPTGSDDSAEDDDHKQRRAALFEVLLSIAPTKDGKGIDAKSLGAHLGRNKDRVAGDLRLERAKGGHAKTARWRVRKLDDKPKRPRPEAPETGGKHNFRIGPENIHQHPPHPPHTHDSQPPTDDRMVDMVDDGGSFFSAGGNVDNNNSSASDFEEGEL